MLGKDVVMHVLLPRRGVPTACDRFDMKSKRALAGEKKYYVSDLGFYFS